MKLLSLHIENFGKFQNFDFNFNDGITCVFGENGFGKTTVAAFIKSIFYGLPDQRGDKFNERKRYYPFNCGKFGGYVRFEKDGEEYRVERVFDKKSSARDEMKAYRNGAPTDELGAVPGVTLFGLDENSFIRTIFINSDDVEVSAASGISAKLNNYLDGTDGENNFETALNKLDKARKNYKADRGGGGKISEQNYKITALRSELENLQSVYDGLPAQYAAFKRLSDETALLEERAERARASALSAQQWDVYDGFCADADAEAAKLKNLEGKYPSGIPSEEDTETLGELLQKKSEYENRLKSAVMSEESCARLTCLRDKFSIGAPSLEEIEQAGENIKKLVALEAEIQAGARIKEKTVLAENAGLTDVKAFKPLPFIITAVVAFLTVAGGIASVFFNIVAGISLISVGAVTLIGDGFLYLLKKIEKPQNPVYTAELISDAESEALTANKVSERDKLSFELKAFFDRFGISETDFHESYLNLKDDLRKYSELCAEEEKRNKEEKEVSANLNACIEGVKEICEKYGVLNEPYLVYRTFERDREERERLIKSLAALKERAEKYREEKKLTVREEFCEDLKEIAEELKAKREALISLNRQIFTDEAEVEKLSEKQTALNDALEYLKILKDRHRIIEAAERELENAEQKLKDRYVAPVKDKFLEYAAQTEESLGKDISMDKSFRVRFDRRGELREDGHLSAGQRSVYALCLRFALTDKMFEKESPFIIMDDPFVNLDDEHMKKVAKLIKQLSQDKQFIYFYCHESRKI